MPAGEPTIIIQPIPVTSVTLEFEAAAQRRRRAYIFGLIFFIIFLITGSIILRFAIIASM